MLKVEFNKIKYLEIVYLKIDGGLCMTEKFDNENPKDESSNNEELNNENINSESPNDENVNFENSTTATETVVENVPKRKTPPKRKPLLPKNPSPARRMAEASVMVASAVIFGLSSTYLPLLWIVALFLWPVPMAIMARRFGLGFALVGSLATLVVLSMFVGPIGAATMFLNMAAVGLWYGYANKHKIKAGKTLIVGVLIAAVCMLGLIFMNMAVAGLQIDTMSEQMDYMIDNYVGIANENGSLESVLGDMTVEEYAVAMKEYIVALIPATFVMMAMIEAVLCFWVTNYSFRRLGYKTSRTPKFRNWHLHWLSLWGLIVAAAMFVGYVYLESEILGVVGSNIMYIYQPLLSVAGISFLYWLIWYYKVPSVVFSLMILLIFLYQTMLPGLMLLGFADCIFDFRQIMRARKQAKKV